MVLVVSIATATLTCWRVLHAWTPGNQFVNVLVVFGLGRFA